MVRSGTWTEAVPPGTIAAVDRRVVKACPARPAVAVAVAVAAVVVAAAVAAEEEGSYD